ncbi:porin [Vibrio sp. CAIM 722]|uniref:Porin n=1 Tax=Vibrio eleionomae TaxID=2653505 RepID=A0A7X4LPG2_9VIBR|nr:porin [Vibrio eleionomae]MZI95442.1 porin [Vibrio eleionomae]
MKKAVLASAIFAALVSGSTLAATVYKADGTELKIGGRVEFRGDFNATDKGVEIDGTMKDKTRARLNIQGKTEISEGLTGFARYEDEQAAGDSDFTQRYMFAGLDFDGQAISFGAQDMAAVQVSSFTDIGQFTGLQKYLDASADHTTGVVAYRGNFNDALNLQATYKANSEDDADSYGLSAVYKLPMGLKLGAAYSADDKQVSSTTSNDDAYQALFGLGYSMDALYLGATYSFGDTGEGDNEFDVIEIAAQYKLTDEAKIQAIYGKTTNKPDGSADVDYDNFVELGGYYSFNANLTSYVAYKINSGDKVTSGTETTRDDEDTIRLGLKYAF